MGRLTRQDLENLRQALAAEIEKTSDNRDRVRLIGAHASDYLRKPDGSIRLWETPEAARRVIRRQRPDLPIRRKPTI